MFFEHSRDLGKWWARQDSNLRQHRYERCVLTAELQAPRRGVMDNKYLSASPSI